MTNKKNRTWKKFLYVVLAICMMVIAQPGYVQASGNYTADWQRWSQGASGYSAMKWGCRVTAYSKMLAEAGYTGFGNPDGFFDWGKARGYFSASDTCELTSIGIAPTKYVSDNGGSASLVGRKSLSGNKAADANTIMDLIRQGYYVVLTCKSHTAYVGREASLNQGTAVLLDSWESRREGPSIQYKNYTLYTFQTANYFRITGNSVSNIDTTAPTISDVCITDVNAEGYTVTCRVEDAGGVVKVQFPTWTTAGDQDDLAANWWDNPNCRGVQNGTTWSYRVRVSDHNNEEGFYNTHIYAWDTAGNSSVVSKNGIYVDRTAPTISDVQVTDISAEGYTVTCKVEDNSGSIARVQFPTWTTANDQDDLAANWWDNPICRGTQNGATWSFRVNVGEHNNEEGWYRTHIYAYDAAGNNRGVAVNDIYVDRTAPVISDVQVTDLDSKGYTVTCKVEDASSEVSKVQFPTWTVSDGQDDLAESWWDNPVCSGTQNEAIWSFRVNVSDHNNESGFYRTHIYAYDAAGNRSEVTRVADMYIKNAENSNTNKDPGEIEHPDTTENNTSGTEDDELDSDDFSELEPTEEDSCFEEGTVITVKNIFGKFKITNASETNPEVTFVGATRKKIKRITIPDTITDNGITYKVTEISANVLKGHKKLNSVVIGRNITKIGKNAFKKCKNLKTITVKSKNINSVGKHAFQGISKKCKIKVPSSKVKLYEKLFFGK